MTDFKVGDRVRVRRTPWIEGEVIGVKRVVQRMRHRQWDYQIKVRGYQNPLAYDEWELVLDNG
jgi:hypothetical protein